MNLSPRSLDPCNVLASHDGEEGAVGATDDDPGQALVTHALADIVDAGARSDRARPRRHRASNSRLIGAAERAAAKHAEHDPALVGDDADVPTFGKSGRHLGD